MARWLSGWRGHDPRRVTLATWTPEIDVTASALVTLDVHHDRGDGSRLLLSLVMPLPAARAIRDALNREIPQ